MEPEKIGDRAAILFVIVLVLFMAWAFIPYWLAFNA